MNFKKSSRKDIGAFGERVAKEYLRRQSFAIIDLNVARKTGELDIVARKANVLHIVEVKTVACLKFPKGNNQDRAYDPAWNLHAKKIQKVVRTAEWYVADKNWRGDWQVDGALVWLRKEDGVARIRYYPQIL